MCINDQIPTLQHDSREGRRKKKAGPLREVKKLGSLLGDKEDIARRKQLSIATMNNMEKVWIRKDHVNEKH